MYSQHMQSTGAHCNKLLFLYPLNTNNYLGDLKYICKNSILHEQASALPAPV